MSVAAIVDQSVPAKQARHRNQPGGVGLGKDHSAECRRLAAAILEVLAGARTPTEAASMLGMSLPRYYQVEAQGLRGLLLACEPRPKGRQPTAESALKALRQENQRLQRDIARHQALARAAQRSLGLAPPAAAPAAKSGKKTRKRRVARALSVATRLQQDNDVVAAPAPASSVEAK